MENNSILEELMNKVNQGMLENAVCLLEAEMEKERQKAFMEGYKYAINMLQDAISNIKTEQS